ncbi:hypothetical protein [Bradyrhizobium sp. Tv2a-2]|uniref:hypothetical protein n=1 Tax=Bradyrhizobium sp. Tv2a-2 TaxID=113395 RepID=UPI0005656B31|nr:hypothetical protein [Bradyrhizobium sp. Tv2a-2]
MVQRDTGSTRRALIRATAASFAAGLFLRLSRVLAADRMTKEQAEYQPTPNGIYSCGQCTMFVAPSSCKVVEGEISTDGWCKAFVLAD